MAGGVNDITIIAGIIIFFIACAIVLPTIHAAFNSDSSIDNNVESLQTNAGNDLAGVGEGTGVFGLIFPSWIINIGKFLVSLFKMFFWSFGALPIYLELFVFLPLRLILAVTIARNAWIGGGG